MNRIGEWDEYFEVWDVTPDNMFRLLARGWKPCPYLSEMMKRRDGLALNIPYGVTFDRENATIILEY